MNLDEIANAIGLEFSGDPEIRISSFAPLELAGATEITFVQGSKQIAKMGKSKARAFIVPLGVRSDRPVIFAENPLYAFARVMELLSPEPQVLGGIDPSAVIGENVRFGDRVSIGANVSVGSGAVLSDNVILRAGARIGRGCEIGSGVVVFENVVLYDGTQIGANCRIQANSTIGADGFGYVKLSSGEYYKIPQRGIVRIEENVEIGANSSIDRATMGVTLIKKGVKIDNQTQIGHNTTVGENSIVVGCCGISGSVTIGDNVVLGGMVGVADHVTIVSGTVCAAKTGVFTDISEPGIYGGPLAMKNMEYKRFLLSGKRIDRLSKQIKALEDAVKQRNDQ